MLLEFVCKLNMQMKINRKQMLKFQRLNKYDNKNNKLAHQLLHTDLKYWDLEMKR